MSATEQKRTIFKNASMLMWSQLMSWVFGLLLLIVMSRYLNPELVGQYALVGSLWMIVNMLTAFGSETFLMKEIARTPERVSELVATALTWRLLFYLVGAVAIAGYIAFMGYSQTIVYLAIILGLGQPLVHLSSVSSAALQGLERMSEISVAGIISKMLYTLLGLLVIFANLGIYGVAAVSVVCSLVYTVMLVRALRRSHRLWVPFTREQALATLGSGLPFLMSGLLLILYQQIDVIVLSQLINYQAVGWYSVARQMTASLFFIPTIVVAALFPALSRSYAQGSAVLGQLLSKGLDMMLLASVPIGLGLVVIAEPLVLLVLGKSYAPSGPIAAALGVALIATYQTTMLGQFLIATDRLHYWMGVMAAGIIATIGLDIVLIPWCQQAFNNGALGGAFSYIITETLMTAVGYMLMPAGARSWRNLWFALRVLGAGLAMVAATWWLRDLFIGIPIVVGAIVYIGLIAAMRVVDPEDVQLVRGALQRKLGRFIKPRKIATAAADIGPPIDPV
ncbi:MAG: flippase [Roseiflexaceae bacterium]|nr:flippase [Roseiflexaceae bacterium]